MESGAAVMSRTPTRAVQVRLPVAVDHYLSELSKERGESKTQIVVEALDCLRQQLLERRMEAGYRELADEQSQLVAAGLAAGLAIIPD
jgi:predicted DNA-binding protein